jgi:hypothetical protein
MKIKEIISLVEDANLTKLMQEAEIKVWEDEAEGLYCETDDGYALMWDNHNEKLFFLPYATNSNGWAKIAEQQNNWLFLCYVTPIDSDDMSRHQIVSDLEFKFYEEINLN